MHDRASAAARRATLTASMPAVAGAARMAMRFDRLRRMAGDAEFARVALPAWGAPANAGSESDEADDVVDRVCAVLGQHGAKQVDAARVELAPGAAAQLGERLVDRHRGAVAALARHRVEGVGDEQDPRLER